MTEVIVNGLLDWTTGLTTMPFGKELIIFIISMLPIVELRGGLIAAAFFNLNPYSSLLICFIGNILPVPFILWFITPIFNKLKKAKLFLKTVNKIERKALSKKDRIEKYKFWSLLIFVGIPLPGTGGWTGSLAAAMIGMEKKKALLAITCGILMAGCIMTILSYGVLKNIIS